MKILVASVVAIFVSFSMGSYEAEAKRMGGGLSFGGKQSFNAPAKRNTQSADAPKQGAANPSAPAGAAGAAGGAARGGMMGMLGGLALGGLLGALFFGGAFENINFFDILIFGLIAFVLYKVFASRKRHAGGQQSDAPATTTGYQAPEYERPESHDAAATTQSRRSERAFNTDLMFKNRAASGGASSSFSSAAPVVSAPADFDQTAFLSGAENLYVRMQKAWDEGELADIREFTTDFMFGEIQDQHRAREQDNVTEIVNLKSELIQVTEVGSNLEASVIFDAELVENGEPATVSEVWHFVKAKNSISPNWILDGIQQVEED